MPTWTVTWTTNPIPPLLLGPVVLPGRRLKSAPTLPLLPSSSSLPLLPRRPQLLLQLHWLDLTESDSVATWLDSTAATARFDSSAVLDSVAIRSFCGALWLPRVRLVKLLSLAPCLIIQVAGKELALGSSKLESSVTATKAPSTGGHPFAQIKISQQ
jgi:hypothetical protein